MCLAGEGGGKGRLKKRRGVEERAGEVPMFVEGLGLGKELWLERGLKKAGRGLDDGKGVTVNEDFVERFAEEPFSKAPDELWLWRSRGLLLSVPGLP